ncbi:hypothetical protein MPTK1_8g02450 [Marchantia polymorpha subsp. ruderalis]|uniref:NodB homology domain-containing protein n=1 Tax=Marchantia polymorpha TaxID=3197 RepID=A0A2R6XJ24_MARPO|nr:hypothetical protein MARPO_0012s0042 [Marchantia polymorpha]BBN18434.1 hypothetical protein Mp_8g02450 [Marchantia polymorpha subsp. ruderalis]|eukprot:PTQ46081.1 hypothetical protein MARPO_0012s0042 [Marchantia polymorpha]
MSASHSLTVLCLDTTPVVQVDLKENGIHATFFVICKSLLKPGESKNTTLRAFNEDHPSDRPAFTTLGKSEMLEELRKKSDAIYRVTGKRPRYCRPPYGSTNHDVQQVFEG